MRERVFLSLSTALLAVLILSVDTLPSLGQGGKKKGFGFQFDPAQIFEKASKGKDYLVIEEQWWGKDTMLLYAKQNGITDGKLTKDQYMKYFEQQKKLREELQASGGGNPMQGGKGGKGGKGFGGPFGGPPAGGEQPGGEQGGGKKGKGKGKRDPEEFFKKWDTNLDGKLTEEEINKNDRFKAEWKTWDENKDNVITLDEYSKYLASRFGIGNEKGERADGEKKGRKGDKGSTEPSVGRVEIEDIVNPEIIVHRTLGKLPDGMPKWFVELDTNKDNQVSLLEWLRASKTAAEFARIDRNDDGLLTIDEAYRHSRPSQTQLVSTKASDEDEDEGEDEGEEGMEKTPKTETTSLGIINPAEILKIASAPNATPGAEVTVRGEKSWQGKKGDFKKGDFKMGDFKKGDFKKGKKNRGFQN